MFVLILYFVALITIATFLYWYLNRGYDYWSKQGIKGPKPIPIFGNHFDMWGEKTHIRVQKWYEQYGNIFGYYKGNEPILVVADPALVNTILVKAFQSFANRHPVCAQPVGLVHMSGDHWKRVRRAVAPAFSSRRMRSMQAVMSDGVANLCRHVGSRLTSDSTRIEVSALDLMSHYVMNCFFQCFYGIDMDGDSRADGRVSAFTAKSFRQFRHHPWREAVSMALNATLLRALAAMGPPADTNAGATKQLTELVVDRVSHMRADRCLKDGVLIELLLAAERNADPMKRLSPSEATATAVSFQGAGYVPTVFMVAYSLCALARNPGVQQRLYDEIVANCPAGDDNDDYDPDYEILGTRLPYLHDFVLEVLRERASMPLSRVATQDYPMAGTGITIKRGQRIEIPVYAITRDERYFPKPEHFDPDRLSKGQGKEFGNLFFGAGPRACVASRFALMLIKTALVRLVRQYRFVAPTHTNCPDTNQEVNNIGGYNLMVGIEKQVK